MVRFRGTCLSFIFAGDKQSWGKSHNPIPTSCVGYGGMRSILLICSTNWDAIVTAWTAHVSCMPVLVHPPVRLWPGSPATNSVMGEFQDPHSHPSWQLLVIPLCFPANRISESSHRVPTPRVSRPYMKGGVCADLDMSRSLCGL